MKFTTVRCARPGLTNGLFVSAYPCRPTRRQLDTLASLPAQRLCFEVRVEGHYAAAERFGEVAMEEIDELETAVRAVLTRWGIPT